MPGKLQLQMWRGNTETRLLRCVDGSGLPAPLDGGVVVFRCVRISDGQELMRKCLVHSDSMSVTHQTLAMQTWGSISGVIALALSPSETRQLSAGMSSRYEIELRLDSEETTLLAGELAGQGGDNDDGN